MTGLSVNTDTLAGADLLGKSVTDLQTGISVSDSGRTISGTLKKVTGYTGFSGAAAEQEGHYLALHCELPEGVEGATIKAGLTGDALNTLDADGIVILRITDTAAQSVKVVVETAAETYERVYSISGLVLED